MKLFSGGFFSKRSPVDFFKNLSEVIKLSSEVNSKKKNLAEAEVALMKESSEFYFLSLEDFTKFLKTEPFDVTQVFKQFKHISDIRAEDKTYIEIHAIPDDSGHIVLCPAKESCEQHKAFIGDKICISTVKRA